MDFRKTLENNKNSKTVHFKDQANFLSHFFFCWPLKLLNKKSTSDLNNDKYRIPPKKLKANNLGTSLEFLWQKEESSFKPSLIKILFRKFGVAFFLYGLFYFLVDLVVTVFQPLCFAKLLLSIHSDQESVFYGVIIVILAFARVFLVNFFYMEMAFLGTKIRTACCSLLYKKVLSLRRSTIEKSGYGKIVSLLTSDVERFDMSFAYMHFLWIFPIKTVMVCCFLYFQFGSSALTGISAVLAVFAFQLYTVKKLSQVKNDAAAKTDYRISLINDILCGIQKIKMYTWEKPFRTLIETCRKSEMRKISRVNCFHLILIFSVVILPHWCIFICLLVAVLSSISLPSYYIFPLINFYDLVITTSENCSEAISYFSNIVALLRRMQEILVAEGKNETYSTNEDYGVGVHLNNVTTKWVPSSPNNTLTSVTFKASPSETVAIVGTAGSGKSTLLQVIMKDLEILRGNVIVGGTISYAPQEAWIFPATVRQNILFGEEMDPKKYDSVIRVCALEPDLCQFSHGDNTLVGERGARLSGGQKARINLARAVYRDADIYLLDDPLSAVDRHVAHHIFNECIQGYLKNKCVVLVTHQTQYLDNVDRIYILENGTVVASGKYKDVENLVGSGVDKPTSKNGKKKSGAITLKNHEVPLENEEECLNTNINPYKIYLLTAGKWMAFLFVFTFFLMQATICATSYFLSFWVNQKHNSPFEYSHGDLKFLYIYIGLILITMLTCFLSLFFFLRKCFQSSRLLHDNLLNKVLQGSMNFFNNHSSGKLLTRFSTDTVIIDEFIPRILIQMFQSLFFVVGATIIVSVLNFWLIIPTVGFYLLFYVVTAISASAVTNLKRFEKTRLSPIFTHVSASLPGLSVIKTFKMQKVLQLEYDNHQDVYNSVYYLSASLFFARAYWLDLISAAYTAIVVAFLLFFRNVVTAASAALIITQSMNTLNKGQFGFKMWTLLSSAMTSVEHIVEYENLETEDDYGNVIPLDTWPQEGKIVFDSVSLRYSSDKPLVLNKISFTVAPGERIGIIGRTGAGKTSLISSIFRLFDFEGYIYIDGVDIKTIPLNLLRSKIGIIPQEPLLFIGSLRRNLDPFGEFTDDQLWSALEDVELKAFVSELPSGFESEISEGGSNMSVGQKQLLCLARIILKKSKIIILDEATASIDLKTDELIQSTLRRKFRNATVLTIAHRLETVMDSDKMLVMDSGMVVEFGDVKELLGNAEGHFANYFKPQEDEDG